MHIRFSNKNILGFWLPLHSLSWNNSFYKHLLGIAILLFSFPIILFSQSDSLVYDGNNPDIYVHDLIAKTTDNFDNNTRTAFFYLDEALSLKDELHDSTKVELYMAAGKLHYYLELYDISFGYLHDALELQNRIDSLESFEIYNSLGTVHLIMKDYDKARLNYLKAKRLFDEHPLPLSVDRSSIHKIMNNLAVIEYFQENFLAAKNYTLQNLKSTIATYDTANMILSYHNLSNAYFGLEEFDKGFVNLNKAIELSRLAKSNRELALLLKNKGSLFIETEGSIDSAIYYTQQAYQLGIEIGHPLLQKESALELYKIYKSKGNYTKALEYKEIEQKLNEEAINSDNIKKINSIELNAKHEQNRRKLLEKQRKNELIFYSIIVFSLLITLLFIMLFRLQRSKATKRKLQNEILNEKLEAKNKEFTAKVMHTLQITELLNDTHDDILAIRDDAKEEVRVKLTSILSKLRNEAFSFNWEEFEKLFVETHQDFYNHLLSDYPDLSKNELRLCAFLKMNLSSKEISAITNQSYRSIVVARSRLRKKLGIDTEQQSITSFLANY